MFAGLIPLMVVTATLFAASRVRQVSQLGNPAAAGCVVAIIFILRRATELMIFVYDKLATGGVQHLPWDDLLSLSTLTYVALQYVVAVIILALLYRYDKVVTAWIAILVIGSLGFVRLLV